MIPPPRQDSGGVFWLCSRLPSGDFCSWSSEADLWVCESIWVVLWGAEHMFSSTANFKEHNRLSPLKKKHYTQGTFFRWTTIITTISLPLSVLCSLHSDLSCTFFFLQRNTINLLKAFHTHTLHSSTSATVSFSPNRFKQ